jgi:putative peptidoglycan lipid II flippase
VRIAIGCVILNFLLNLTLGLGTPLAHVGIALSAAIAAWVNAAFLAKLATRRGYLEADARLKSKIPRMAVASAVMAAALVGTERLLTPPLHGGEVERAIALAILVAVGLTVFALCALALKAAAWADVKSRLPLTRRRANGHKAAP